MSYRSSRHNCKGRSFLFRKFNSSKTTQMIRMEKKLFWSFHFCVEKVGEVLKFQSSRYVCNIALNESRSFATLLGYFRGFLSARSRAFVRAKTFGSPKWPEDFGNPPWRHLSVVIYTQMLKIWNLLFFRIYVPTMLSLFLIKLLKYYLSLRVENFNDMEPSVGFFPKISFSNITVQRNVKYVLMNDCKD